VRARAHVVAKAKTCRPKRWVESQVCSACLSTGSWSLEWVPRPWTKSTQRWPACRARRRNSFTAPRASSRVMPWRSKCAWIANSPRRSLATMAWSSPVTRPSMNSSESEMSNGASPEMSARKASMASRSGCQTAPSASRGALGGAIPAPRSTGRTPRVASAQSSLSVRGGGTGRGGGPRSARGAPLPFRAFASSRSPCSRRSRSVRKASLKGRSFLDTEGL